MMRVHSKALDSTGVTVISYLVHFTENMSNLYLFQRAIQVIITCINSQFSHGKVLKVLNHVINIDFSSRISYGAIKELIRCY